MLLVATAASLTSVPAMAPATGSTGAPIGTISKLTKGRTSAERQFPLARDT